MKQIFRHIIHLFYPETCLGCNGLLLEGEIVLCTNCRHELPLTQHHLQLDNDAYKRLSGKVPVEMVMSMLVFEKKGLVQELIHKLKYKGNQEIGSFLGSWYAEVIKDKFQDVHQIIPVPLHKRRLRQRGYNQVTTFCQKISEGLNIPINDRLLVRKYYAKTQTKKSFGVRTSVTGEVFDLCFMPDDTPKHYLLVDDVLTSGTTLEQCVRALLKIPEAKVSVITMALTY